MNVLGGNRDQLRMCAVAVLAEDVPAILEPGIEDDLVADLEARDPFADRLDHAGSIRAQDARLGNRRKPHAQPDVEMVERGGLEANEHLARAWFGIRHVLVAQDVGAALLVDADRFHRPILSTAATVASVTAGELERLAEELGIDVLGTAHAMP